MKLLIDEFHTVGLRHCFPHHYSCPMTFLPLEHLGADFKKNLYQFLRLRMSPF